MQNKRIAVNVSADDIRYVKQFFNPDGLPLAAVLASIIREVVKDDRNSHKAAVAQLHTGARS